MYIKPFHSSKNLRVLGSDPDITKKNVSDRNNQDLLLISTSSSPFLSSKRDGSSLQTLLISSGHLLPAGDAHKEGSEHSPDSDQKTIGDKQSPEHLGIVPSVCQTRKDGEQHNPARGEDLKERFLKHALSPIREYCSPFRVYVPHGQTSIRMKVDQ